MIYRAQGEARPGAVNAHVVGQKHIKMPAAGFCSKPDEMSANQSRNLGQM